MALTHNFFGIETTTTPEWTVSNGMVAKVVDAAGAQRIRVALGGKLEIQGSAGANIFTLEGVRQADCYIYRAGSTAIIFHNGVEIFRDTMTADSQSIVFGGDSSNTQILTSSGGFKLGSTTLVALETTAPVFASAAVHGANLVMSYTEANVLDPTHIPDVGAFNVMVNGSANAVTAVVVNGSAKTVTLTLTSAVVAGQSVTVAYTDPTAGNDANAIQDAAGNDAASLAPITLDTVAPTLILSSPLDNAINVNATAPIVLTFSENVVPISGGIIYISKSPDDPNMYMIPVTDSQVVINGSIVTITPTTPLTKGTTYNVQINPGVLEDSSGNDFAGITTVQSLNFSTLDNINHVVTMNATQSDDYLTNGVAFGFGTAITVTGSGAVLASQAGTIHNLGGTDISLNASDNLVSLSVLRAEETLVYGGVSFDHSDVITVSGITPIALAPSLINLGGNSITLDVNIDTSASVAMNASTAINVTAGHWFFNAVNDNLTYWDSANSTSHTIALTGVIDVTVTGAGVITMTL
jgi:uncharacterized repeat protein (TIGR02059 family)